MFIVHADSVFRVEPGTSPDYNRDNPLLRLLRLLEATRLAAERDAYLMDHAQYLYPIEQLELYSPSPPNQDLVDPTRQDVKTDFQKQNVRRFVLGDTFLTRGWVATDAWTAPFLRLSYRAGPDTPLAEAAGGALGNRIKVWLRVGARAAEAPIAVPYNADSDRYEVELWGYAGGDLRGWLDDKGRAAFDRGELRAAPGLLGGSLSDFDREGLDDRYLVDVAPDNAMHPVLPLHVEVAWADESERFWDSRGGANYQYEFNMVVRGWDNYLGVGFSPNPHGGVGSLEYRNLLSNYGRYAGRGELARRLEAWNFDAHGSKDHGNALEAFLAVDYMDLHILKPNSGIGLHRHRDNQEVFLMMEGRGFMVVGDWCQMPQRERCFEVRTLRPGHFALLKGGNLHALMNPTDEDLHLFMFGGYD